MRKSTLAVLVAGSAAAYYLVRRSRLPIERRDLLMRRTMNERLAPILMRYGAIDGTRTGFGVIEHVGRVSGTRRRTMVHPIPLGDRVAVPLAFGEKAQWPQNVVAAGRCRVQFRDHVYSLTNPRPQDGAEIEGLPRVDGAIGRAFGGRYLVMDVDSVVPGRFEEAGEEVAAVGA
jgi:deazaflavin-dependent oxidoreductase (nitroreductase family)